MLGLIHGALDVQTPDVLPIFFCNDSRKLTPKWMSNTSSSSVIVTWPKAAARHSTLFIQNLSWTSLLSTMATTFSLWLSKEGNLLSSLRPGPRICRIYLIRDSEAKKVPYFLATFWTNFLFLLNFFSTLMSMWGLSITLASSQMPLVLQNTYRELGAGSGLKPDGAQEEFVLLRVRVLQDDLQLHHLQKPTAKYPKTSW